MKDTRILYLIGGPREDINLEKIKIMTNEYYLRASWETTCIERDDLKNQIKVLSAIKNGLETSLKECLYTHNLLLEYIKYTEIKEDMKDSDFKLFCNIRNKLHELGVYPFKNKL